MALFLATNFVNFINFLFSILVLKITEPQIMSVVAMYIAIQLAAFLFFTGEQNKIASNFAANHSHEKTHHTNNRSYDLIFFISVACNFLILLSSNDTMLRSLVSVVFIISILLSRNLMQIRGFYLGKEKNLSYSFSIVLENSLKFIFVLTAALLLKDITYIVLGLSLAPIVTWFVHRLQIKISQPNQSFLGANLNQLFSIFLFIQLLFFLSFDLPYVLFGVMSEPSELSANLAFLGITAKIIFFGSISFSLIIITKLAGLKSSSDELRSLNFSYFLIIIGSLILVTLSIFFPTEIILLIAKADFLQMSDVLFLAFSSSCIFTLMFITLNGMAARNDASLNSLITFIIVISISLSIGVSTSFVSISLFLKLQIGVFLFFFIICNFSLRKSIINNRKRTIFSYAKSN